MDSLAATLQGLAKVVFLRGSPERIFYTRRRFIVSLLLAVAASAAVQAFYFNDHLVFVILRVFAELTMFMLAIVFLTRKIARFRLAYAMFVLVLISLAADLVLIVLSVPVPESVRGGVGYGVGLVALYGASNTVAWGLRKPLHHGAGVMALYVAAVVGLDSAFRSLYQTMAGG